MVPPSSQYGWICPSLKLYKSKYHKDASKERTPRVWVLQENFVWTY
uniref:Uncharacterized protein n=1 Tax=Arundo donax TaxID=35708 RepID=A0A0A9FX77_ARUDO